MKADTPVSRRDFLRTGATTAAGLTIAFYIPSRFTAIARGETPLAASDDAAFAPNGWVHIGIDGIVTITVDKSEMGQGVNTSYPMLVAEELDADFAQVRVGAAPENPAGWTRRMGTGGSSSVRSSYDTLRKAGATARAMLVAAAARQWGVEAATCRTEKGTVIHAATGRALAYGALASRAGSLPVPADAPLKDPKDFRILGTRVRRLDTPVKVNGTARFGIDTRLPGMLYASIERSPAFGGSITRVDDSRARSMPGVKRVVQLAAVKSARSERAVAVVADSYWHALSARRALHIEWNDGPNGSLDSAAISARLAQLAEQAGLPARTEGDAGAAMQGAAKTIEAVYEVPYLAHATMEPMNCTAHVRATGCDVWAPTQGQSGAQAVAAEVAEMPPEQVRVHTTYLGGGFGRRSETDFVAEAVQLSKVMGAPVQVIDIREDDVRHDFYRPTTYNRFAAGFDASGNPVAWTHRIVGASIATSKGRPPRDGIDGSLVEGAANVPYEIPNILVEQTIADLPIPLGYWRSVGSSHNAYLTECFVDEVARAAGKDPYEFRRALLAKHPRHLGVLELAAQKAGWGTPLPAGRTRGIAVAESFGSYVAEVAEVSLDGKGMPRVHHVVCAVDCGPVVNPDTIEAQMQSGIVYGLTAALYGDITIERGRVLQGNFNDYPMLRMKEMPKVDVYIVPSTEKQGGIGEPGTPPIAPAVCNAIFAATGVPVRRLPIIRDGKSRIAGVM
ncbi:MAG TPA: xanthine dehydrogenase family protein molybdopterin-binding subunit [Gemmatimonadaceae bacterium]|nr:xanthine dehydrogenase family protein molybdopterin-binding subunit [Gemmatimonadaceae bacterium]